MNSIQKTLKVISMTILDKIVKIKFSQTLELKNAAEKFEYMKSHCKKW